MEDDIFSGTSTIPEKNLSEVSMLIDNKDKDGPEQYHQLEEILITRKIERNKGSKYYLNEKEVRARDAQTFFADLSTGAHSPSLISQGKIGQLVTAKPIERRTILEEAAGIAGIHARRQEAETRLNAAENNLKRADELKKQQQKQLDNLKKQAEEATKYKEISREIKRAEAGLYYLRLIEIEKNKKEILENVSEQDDEISAIKIDLNHNTELLNEENNKLAPLRDKKLESLAKLQKINLDMTNLEEEEKRIKKLSSKLESSLATVDSDLEREKSISLDASLNEKRILEEKEELLKTEKTFGTNEAEINENLELSKKNLDDLKKELDSLIFEIGKLIDEEKKVPKNLFNNLKVLVNKITSAHENYATNYSKNETVKSDSIKRKERIKNIDIELENWKSLKVNSEKMINNLQERKKKINNEMKENQKNPEIIATTKGQNIQNLENTKKRSEELEEELSSAEERFNKINKNIKEVQEKLTIQEKIKQEMRQR